MLVQLLPVQLLLLLLTRSAVGRNGSVHSLAGNPFDCKHVDAKGFKFDLSRLPAPVTISNTEDTPPTKTTTSIEINLCESLDRKGAESEQCPPGTRICLKIFNEKTGEADRLTQVIGAGGLEGSEWAWSAELGERLDGAERALELEFHGSQYAQHSQRTEIDLKCDHNAAKDSKPEMKKYDKGDGKLKLTWLSPWACAAHFPGSGEGGDSKSDDDDKSDKDKSGSGKSSGGWGFFSWFFFLIFFGGAAYFAHGLWRNYNEYGVIELPNKDFWREAPYIAKDMGKHIYSTVSGQGSSRGAYEPV